MLIFYGRNGSANIQGAAINSYFALQLNSFPTNGTKLKKLLETHSVINNNLGIFVETHISIDDDYNKGAIYLLLSSDPNDNQSNGARLVFMRIIGTFVEISNNEGRKDTIGIR